MSTADNTFCEVSLNGQKLVLDASGTIFLPEFSTLLVSDLHFEKGSFLASFRSMLPLYDTTETLSRLEKVVLKYSPKTVVCMGDSFHDFNAEARISEADVSKLNELCKNDGACNWVWVLGNHDKFFPKNIIGRQVEAYELGGISLSHEKTGAEFEIIGHFHPKARLSLQGHKISGKCFLYDKNLLIMPSFGTFTGGLYIDAPAIKAQFKNKPKACLIYREKLWEI